MKKYYISSVKGDHPIARYSNNFYELILRSRGYIFMDSSMSSIDILSAISSRDQVHMEISATRKKETELLYLMLRAKYRYVSVTLHDPPTINFPYWEFKSTVLNKFSRLYAFYADRFGETEDYMRRIKSIYVLSEKGLERTKKRYHTENVFYLPCLIDPHELEHKAEPEKKGFFLSGSVPEDTETLGKIISGRPLPVHYHSAEEVGKQFKD